MTNPRNTVAHLIEFLQTLPPTTEVQILKEVDGGYSAYTDWTGITVPLIDPDEDERASNPWQVVYGEGIDYCGPTPNNPSSVLFLGEQ
jgi:hypothetical protein